MLIRSTVNFLNQEVVKEGIKNVVGSVTFAIGLIELYDVYMIIRGRNISAEIDPAQSKWLQVAAKVAIFAAKISLILSACVSHPGCYLIGSLMGIIVSPAKLDSLFGPNTTFAVNPWHPRHVISFTAMALAIPSFLLMIFQSIYPKESVKQTKSHESCLNDSRVNHCVIFNTLTSRPMLHIGNHICHSV